MAGALCGGQGAGVGIAVDASGDVFVAGETTSAGWVSGGFDTSHNGYDDAFVVKLSSSGGHLWSTCLGGSDYDSHPSAPATPNHSTLISSSWGAKWA